MPSRLAKLFDEQKDKGGAGGRWATRHQRNTLEQAFLRQAEIILLDDNPFQFIIVSSLNIFNLEKKQRYCLIMDCGHTKNGINRIFNCKIANEFETLIN